MRNTGRSPTEKEREREMRETGTTVGHLSLSPCANIYTSHSQPPPRPHSHPACTLALSVRQKADHRSRSTSRYILFEVSTVLILTSLAFPFFRIEIDSSHLRFNNQTQIRMGIFISTLLLFSAFITSYAKLDDTSRNNRRRGKTS